MKPTRRIFLLLVACNVIAGARAEESPAAPGPAESTASRLKLMFSPALLDEKSAPAPAGAVVLPKFEVRDSQLQLTPRDVQTGATILAAAKARYLNPVYQKTGGQLMAVLELIEVYRGADDARYKQLKELLFDTYQHGPDRTPGALRRR